MPKLERGDPVVHPKMLVHWTLKEKSEYHLDDYKIRLEEILQDGLLFGEVKENFPLFGKKVRKIKKPMLCFTETRLSVSVSGPNKLPFKYGRLGIGLHRKFVVRNGGNPVFYVNAMDSANISQMMNKQEELKWFVKTMNNPKYDKEQKWDNHGFSNYNDLEWRILPDINMQIKSLFETKDAALSKYSIWKKDNGIFYLRLTPKKRCIECVIFPDEETQDHCMETLLNYFHNGHLPIVTTLNRLKHL